MFFLEYEPQTHFQGKKLRLFRAFALFPVLYEVGALVLRITMIVTGLKPPYIVYPLLTTKPFMSFILFIILALHIRFDESRFKKRDKSPEDFEEYTRTNDHSLRFSVFTSIMILITGLIDFLVYIISTVYLTYQATGTSLNGDLTQEAIRRGDSGCDEGCGRMEIRGALHDDSPDSCYPAVLLHTETQK